MALRLLAPLDTLSTHPDFTFRSWQDRAHLRDLRQVLSNNPKRFFDPLTVWKNHDDEKFIVIDGHYRVEAYRQAGQATRKVPIRVFEGNREEAIIWALSSNAKAKLPLTSKERQDAAWRLVRLAQGASEPSYSKSLIADASGVSERLVGYMRVRWKEVQVQGHEAVASLTGHWAADREAGGSQGNYELLSDAQREEQIKALSEQFRDLTDRRKRGGDLPILGDRHAVYESISMAYGEAWVKGFFDFVLTDDADEWGSDFINTDRVDEADADEPCF